MTIDDLIAAAEATLRARNDRLVDLQAVVTAGTAERSTREQRIAAEAVTTEHVRAAIADRDRAQVDVDLLLREKSDDARSTALQAQSHPTGATPPAQERTMTFHISEPSTYTREAAADGHRSFLVDLYRAQVRQDPGAQARLAQHGREVEASGRMSQRDVTTGNVAGFVPPQYLVEQFADLARSGRPTADLCTRMPLPATGMTLTVPRITTGTTVTAQNGENTATSATSIDDTLLQVPVNTTSGYVDISRQAIERGELVEQIVLADLASAYNVALDSQILAGSGSDGAHTGFLSTGSINTVTYTDASPTLAEAYPKIADAIGRVVSQRLTGPTAIVMSPAVWAWFNSTLSTSFPLIGQSGANANSIGTAGAPTYPGPVGKLMGVPVVLDGNMPANLGTGTNETRILVADFRDAFLFEDPSAAPAQLRFDGVGSSTLTVRLQAYGYSAFTAGRRPGAVSVIAGSGMIVPAM